MSIITNAGRDDRLSREERAAADIELQNQGVMQDAEARARAAAARRDAIKAPILLGGDEKLTFGEGEEQITTDRLVVKYQLEEPDYDESIPSLAPYVLEYAWTPWWPLMRPKGSQGGLRPVLPPKAWEALIDSGMYCLKCLSRHAVMNPAKCAGCDMTAEHRENVLRFLEERGEKIEEHRENRSTRRARKRMMRRSSGGVYLPGGVGG